MLILLVMAAGIFVGLFLPKKLQKANGVLQSIFIGMLVFVMGVKLGSRPQLGQELLGLGWESVLLGVVPTLLSVVLVYPLSRLFLEKPAQTSRRKRNARDSDLEGDRDCFMSP